MKEISLMDYFKEKVPSTGIMASYMKETSHIIKSVELANSHGRMELSMKVK
jgi:hypothetical protein